MDEGDWVDAGLYLPQAPNAAERKALLGYLTGRGATLEQLRDAHERGELPGLAGELALGPTVPVITIGELADRCGVPESLVTRILLAAGLPTGPDDRVPADLQGVIEGFTVGADIMGEDALLAFTRVLGAAATNAAEGAVALFYAQLGPGTQRHGSDELTRARQSEAASAAFLVIPEVFSRLLTAQFHRATRRAAVSRIAPVSGEGGDEANEARTTEVIALGFVDLVGSTAWAEELSLRDQSLALSRFESAAWSSAVSAGGRVVKTIGDEVFFAAPSVDAACRIGMEVCQAAGDDAVLPAARGAIGYGGVTPREGDYFGPLVNMVSRLVKVAAPGQLVLTDRAAEALAPGPWTVRSLDLRYVRGIDHPVPVFSVSATDRITDP